VAGSPCGTRGTRSSRDRPCRVGRSVPGLPGGSPGSREDHRHAWRRAAPPGPGRGRRGRLRRVSRAAGNRTADGGPGGCPPAGGGIPWPDVRGNGPGRRAASASPGRPGRRARPHQRARVGPERQAVAGHPGPARRRHRGDHDRQRPAPGDHFGHRRAHHRDTGPRARPGLGGPPGRSDRAGRLLTGTAAPPDAARQHLSGRAGSAGPHPAQRVFRLAARAGIDVHVVAPHEVAAL
jgi:hypothetical protein